MFLSFFYTPKLNFVIQIIIFTIIPVAQFHFGDRKWKGTQFLLQCQMCIVLTDPQSVWRALLSLSNWEGGLAGLIDSGPLARQSPRTWGLGARQADFNHACFPLIGSTHNSPGRLLFPSTAVLQKKTKRNKLIPTFYFTSHCLGEGKCAE